MKPVQFTPEMTAYVVANYKNTTLRELAIELGIGYSTLRRQIPHIVNETGLALRRRGKRMNSTPDSEWQLMLERYNDGITIRRLAEHHNMPASTIRRGLRYYANKNNCYLRNEGKDAYLRRARDAAIVEMVEKGFTYGDIAHKLKSAGVTRSVVAGVIMRRRDKERYA